MERTVSEKNMNKTALNFNTKRPISQNAPKRRPETATNVKYINKSDPIEILPSEVIIKDFEINQTYEVIILVRNLTRVPRKIRIFQPKTSKFRCDYDMQGSIAAGLAMKLVLTFESSTLNDYHDSLVIISDEGFKFELPLHAYMPQAQIVFEPFLNFGFVQLGKSKTETVVFRNEGLKEGVVEIKTEKSELFKIDREKFYVMSKQSVPVNITYEPKEAGILRAPLFITVQGQAIQRQIDVSATSVEFSMFIIDENGQQTTEFDFGDIYYGQSAEIPATLVNNTPNKYSFKTKFLVGKQTAFDEAASLQTPNELGLEQTQRVMNCIPEAGIIDSYSQIPLKLICKPRVSPKEETFTKNYAMVKEYPRMREDFDKDFPYSCFFSFDGRDNEDDSLYLHLQARGICPTIKVSHPGVDFGDCQVNEKRDFLLTIENEHEKLPVSISFPKISQFNVDVKNVKLMGNEKVPVTISFEPKNMGKFSNFIDMTLFGSYRIPIRVSGIALSYVSKTKQRRGPEAIKEDFEKPKDYIDEDRPATRNKAVRKNDKFIITTQEGFNVPLMNPEATNISEKLDVLFADRNNKAKYNNFLKSQRNDRVQEKKEAAIKEKFEKMKTKLKEQNPNLFPQDKDDDAKPEPPFDMEFWFKMASDVDLGEPNITLPNQRDPLWVNKPLGKYEPIGEVKNEQFKPDPNKPGKKKFSPHPASHAEERDVHLELSPDMLQKVFSGPKSIDFGHIYKKSRASKYFSVKNELRTSIMVRINVDGIDELSETDTEPQIIPSMQTGVFEIVCSSRIEQSFKNYATYIINEHHRFKFLVSAQIEPVQLDLSREVLKFTFPDTNVEMFTTETLKIINKGNAPGKYKWEKAIQSDVFTVDKVQGEVPANGGEVPVTISYKPSGRVFKGEEEILKLKVEEGIERTIKCIGFVTESKCIWRGPLVYQFGEIPIGQTKTFSLSLANVSKTTATYHILTDKLPSCMTITPTKGRIGMDQTEIITVTIQSNEEMIINHDLTALIRGGQPQKICLQGEVVVPKIYIKEEEFDFGEVLYDNTAKLLMTIVNESSIRAQLVLDLRPRVGMLVRPPGIECLEVVPAQEVGDDQSSIMQSVNKDDNESSDEEGLVDDRSPSEAGDSSDEEKERPPSKVKLIKLKPNSSLQFYLKFTPKDAVHYIFDLPMTLEGYGKMEGLARHISCQGRPREFLMEPRELVFKKKIIKANEKLYPNFEDVRIWNAEKRTLKWVFDTKPLEAEKAFTITPSEGRIEAGQMAILRIGFNPQQARVYESKVMVYIDDNPVPYSEIVLKGEGAHPKLLFDRREVILPLSPLDVMAKSTFRIINDGYENLTIAKPKVSADLGSIELDFRFPDGQSVNNITKTRLKVEVGVKYKKPISFTTRIDIFDDENVAYSLMVSGTVDNCLLTNQPFLQRFSEEEYAIVAEDGKPIRIQETDDDAASHSSPRAGAHSIAISKAGSHTSRGAVTLLGFTPIPEHMITKSAEHVVRWLNFNCLLNGITKYPADVIENNGGQIFELIAFLTGKVPPCKASLANVTNKTERIRVLWKQYDDLIRMLKENGALLNTIRPEYLLKYADFNSYIKGNPVQNCNIFKISEAKFNYLSTDAWITLFYQIIKIYYLTRVTVKAYKALPGVPAEKSQIPDYYLEGSNIYSAHEGILLRWMELQCELLRPNAQPIRVKNFGDSLRDGVVLANVLQSYVGLGRINALKELRLAPQNEDDYEWNANRIIAALNEIKLQTHINARDILVPSQREMMLFCLYLFNNLPHYIPKSAVEFPCILGESITKYIELHNPTNRTISYRVELENIKKGEPSDFSVEIDEIKLEPKSTQKVPVTFMSRISKPVQARIVFTSKKEGNTQAAAIVFNLISKITGRIPVGKTEIKTKLYTMTSKDIPVENPFNKPVNFSIEIQIEDLNKPSAEEEAKKKKPPKSAKNKPLEIETPKKAVVPQAFFIKQSKLPKIPPKGYQSLTLWFLPFLMETQVCHVILVDENVGEIQYTITGQVELPDVIPYEPRTSQFTLDANQPLEMPVSFRNKYLEEAKIKWKQNANVELREAYDKALKQQEIQDQIIFDVENPSTFLLTPPQFAVSDSRRRAQDKKDQQQQQQQLQKSEKDKKKGARFGLDTSFDSRMNESMLGGVADNKMNIGLAFRQPVPEYKARIILRSLDRSDIRVYEFSLTVMPRPIKATLEFWVPAGEKQVQPIPIVNNSEKDWHIRVEWKRFENGEYFYGTKGDNFYVKHNDRGDYLLTFAPSWKCESKALLTFKNPLTYDLFEYELIGHGEDPMSRGNIHLKCKVREKTSHTFKIENPYEDEPAIYDVTTDLPEGWIIGAKQFKVPISKEAKYKLEVMPILGGVFTGSITFTDQRGRYQWWTITIEADSPKSEKVVDMVAEVRRKIAFEVTLSNPLDKPVNYEVVINGEGLLGDTNLFIEPNGVRDYQLIFCPLRAMNTKGSVAFVDEKLGEVWYELNLIGKESPPVRLDTLHAELGKIAQHEVELENPAGKAVQVKYRNTNPGNFAVLEDTIVIPAYDSTFVHIQYMPSELETIEQGEIIFESEEIGNWHFQVFGKGTPPTKFETKVIPGALNKDISSTVLFKNPFKDSVSVAVSLDRTKGNADAFDLLLKKSVVQVAGFSQVQIPFSFLPRAIANYYTEIVVMLNERISWRYPIQGITEAYSQNLDIHIETKCRTKLEQELKFELPGIADVKPDDTFDLTITQVPKHLANVLVEKRHPWLKFESIKNTLESPLDALVYKVVFHPLKPFKATLEIGINRSSGGRWKFKILVESHDPEPDDTIAIISPLNKTSTITFKLTNIYKNKTADFKAYFTSTSDPELTVQPKEGTLPPFDHDGQIFYVSFLPYEYGRIKQGKLIIETAEMYWSYQVKGQFPKYNPPKPKASRLDNQLPKEFEERLSAARTTSKNFLAENITRMKIRDFSSSPERSASNSPQRKQSPGR